MKQLLPHVVRGLSLSEKTPCMVFLSGFPDDETSWDQLASNFATSHATLACALPGYSPTDKTPVPRWGYSFDQVVDMLRETITTEFGERKIVLVVHDWGSYVGMIYAQRYSDSVEKLVTLDVGMYGPKDMTLKSNLIDLAYKSTLATAFVFRAIGLSVFGHLTCALFPWSLVGPCPHETKVPPRVSQWFKKPDLAMCYPYFHLFKGIATKSISMPKFPTMPVLFLYGKNKRIMFHSDKFLNKLNQATDGSTSVAMDCGHFLQAQKPEETAKAVSDFLR